MKNIGRLTIIIGTMFAGKSEELTNQFHIKTRISKAQTFYFKPATDTRDKINTICTHKGYIQEVIPIIPEKDEDIVIFVQDKINGKKLFIFIDEIQFFNLTIVNVIKKLLTLGCFIFVGGLRSDYLGKPFDTVSNIIAIADEVIIKKAVCMYEYPDGSICGEPAIFSQMFDENKNPIISDYQGRIHIGASEKYETRCRKHFTDQELLNYNLEKQSRISIIL